MPNIIVVDTERLKTFSRLFYEVDIQSNDIIYYFKQPNIGRDITKYEKELIEETNARIVYKNVDSPNGAIDFEITAFIVSLMFKNEGNIILVTSNKNYRMLKNTLKKELNFDLNVIMLDRCIENDFNKSEKVNSIVEEYELKSKSKFTRLLSSCNNTLALNNSLTKTYKEKGKLIFQDIREEFIRIREIDKIMSIYDSSSHEVNSILRISNDADTFLNVLYEHFRGDSLDILKSMEKQLKTLIDRETDE